MSKTITEYGLGASIDGVLVTYQFSPKPDFEKSEITLLTAGPHLNAEKQLTEKTKRNFKTQILEFEREKQQAVFSGARDFKSL